VDDETGGTGSPEDGHTFEISYRSRGSYTVTGDPEHRDAPDFDGFVHRVEVRAWNLRDALRRAAELPFDVLMGEQSEVPAVVEQPCAQCGLPVHDFHGDAVWRDVNGGLTCDQLPVRVNSPFHRPGPPER
jgi:hypothetical protein